MTDQGSGQRGEDAVLQADGGPVTAANMCGSKMCSRQHRTIFGRCYCALPKGHEGEHYCELPYPAWARWPWQTCKAVTYDEYGTCRCDLVKRHGGHHRAERGMYDVVWSSVPRLVDHAH